MSDRSGKILLRAATPDDATPAARLMTVLGYPSSPESMRGRLKAIGADPSYHAVVAEVEGEVRGLIGLRRGWLFESDQPHAQIVALVVDEDYQGMGIGTRLVDYAEDWARTRGAATVSLTSGNRRRDAYAFYEHQGFTATGSRFVKKL